MKLHRIVLFATLVLLISFAIQFIHPKDGIMLTKNFSFYFPSASEIFAPKDREAQQRLQAILHEDLQEDSTQRAARSKADSIRIAYVRDSIRQVQLSIHYPDQDRSMLYNFFNTLDKLKNTNRPVHIVHYGDSQIEGDRITAYIRQKLQEQFGGKGPGWLPVKPLAYPRSVILNHSDNWTSHHFYNQGDSTLSHRMFGHMGIFSRFTPYAVDSVTQDSTLHTAWVSYKASSRSYSHTRNFKDVRIFYGKNTQPVILEIVHKDSVVFQTELSPTLTPRVVRHRFPKYVNEVMLRFTGIDSPDIYGISLDDTQGVMVDNVGMRGDSGASFTSLEEDSYRAFREFNIPLFILQFGGNAVPYAQTEARINGYARNFKRNIQYLKQLKPDAAIIVIGPSDMSVQDGTNWVTYPQLPTLRDALKTAAHEAGAAYWDLFEAMGGKGSMKEWVNANPPLAIKDYAHFTDKGTVKVSQWFTEALLNDYQAYKQTKNTQSEGEKEKHATH